MIVVTHSEIAAFLDCRREWNWSSVQEFALPHRYDGALALGSRVHAGVEAHYLGRDAMARHTELATADVRALERLVDSGERPGWELDQLYQDVIVGRNCVTAFTDWVTDEDPNDGLTVEGVEQVLETPILDGRVLLRGKADVVFRRDDGVGLIVDDTKTTSAYEGGLREVLERSYQHHVYIALLQRLRPEEASVRAQYTVLRKVRNLKRVKTPVVTRFKVPGTLRSGPIKFRQIERIAAEMLRTIELAETEGSTVMYPSPGRPCRWCDYRHPCELVDESPLAARDMLDRVYVRTGRYSRYESAE